FEAAAKNAPGEAAATAAAYAAEAANSLFRETHQLTGAMGFTREHDLHVFSMRLQALRLELGGVSAHRRAITEQRWQASRSQQGREAPAKRGEAERSVGPRKDGKPSEVH